jgi:hypothetical protein
MARTSFIRQQADCWWAIPANIGLTKKLSSIARWTLFAALATTAAAYAQQPAPPQQPGQVAALVVMTPNGPATCATWVQWRSPGANPTDRAAIEYWAEGYLSGLAAGSRHDVIGAFRREVLAAWLDRYCVSNPPTKLPLAINDLGRAMLAHPNGQLP